MDFHAMKRKKLQALCKKHRIFPANMKNVEMADRLASLFEKETEEPLTDSTSLSEDSLECDGIIKDDLVVSKEAKRVRFSPENEVFEFTRSVKRCQAKNVRRRSKGPVQDLQQNGIELRRSKRISAKGKTISGSNQNEAKTRRGRWPDVTKALKLPRRIGSTASSQQESKVTGLMVLEQFEYEDTSDGLSGSDQDGFKLEMTRRRSIRLASKAGALLPVQRSKRLADIEDKEEKLVKDNAKEVSVDSEFHDTEKYHRKNVQDEPKVEKVPRRFVNDIDVQTNTQDQRRSIRLKARAANTSMGGETSDGRRLCSAKESKEERKTKQTKGSTVVNNQEGELVKNKTKEPSRHDSFEAPIVVEGNLVQKKTDETLEKKRDRSAEPGISQSAQFEQEEAGVANVESRGSSKKLKKMNQECAKDKPHGMIEKSPSSSETKAAESVMITENVLDSTLKKLVDSSQRTNTQELNSELMEGNHEEKLEGDTVLMDAIEDDKNEVSSCSVLLSERSSPYSVQFAVSNARAELGVPTGHILVKDVASTVIAEENTKTKEEILICTPISELKEHSSVEAILENSTECWKEIHPGKDDEKWSFGKEVQAANLHGNFFEYNTENNSAVEEMEITKVGCVSVGQCVNLTPEELLDEYTQLEPEEGGGANVEAKGSSKKMKTVNQEFVKDKSQGMNEDSPSTSETKATEPVMISENALDSTLKFSGYISPVRKTQELDSELLQGEREEKPEQDTFLMAAIKEREEASSLAVFLIKGSELSNPEVQLSVETTPPPASAVSNPAAELGVPTSHILVKDIVSTVIAKEEIKTKEGIHISVPRSELKEHSFVAKLAEAEANLESSAECWNAIQSSKDSEKDSLEETIQAENLNGKFSEYNTENIKVGCISVNHCVKALSLPLPRNNDASAFDDLAIFTTPEKKLMLMEQISEKGKTLAVDSVTHHNDAEVEESGPSTDNQNQINDVLEELAITDNNEADELIEAKNIQMGIEGNLLLNSSSGSYVSGKTCILAGTENEDEVGVPIATAFEKAISLTSDELTVQNHMNEKDEEMITKVTTPISEETMNSSPENRKAYLNNDESGTLSKRQARRETILITRTQVKPTRHDMKENAPNSKIVQNLNVTAPRTSKRKPLQDLSKN